MTDKEMLELAAKAAGLDVEWKSWTTSRIAEFGTIKHTKREGFIYKSKGWNPLTDDGDALRLAISLGFYVGLQSVEVWKDGKEWINIFEDGEDPYAATRRAITKAAAAIGGGDSCLT